MIRPLYSALANLVQARLNCIDSGNMEWLDRHEERIDALVKEALPSGSGFDAGTTLDFDRSTGAKLVLTTAYHHMVEGSYDGWTEHTVTVTASMVDGFDLKIGGRDRNDVKDYIADTFANALRQEVTRDGRLVAFVQPAYYAQEAQGATEIMHTLDPEARPLVNVKAPPSSESDAHTMHLHRMLVEDLLDAMNRRALDATA